MFLKVTLIKMDAKTLGNHVLLSRRDLGMTQEDLANRVGVSRAYVTNIEQGRAKNVGIDVVFGLARELGVSVAYLLGISDDPLSETTELTLKETSTEYVLFEAEDPADLRLVRQIVDELMALSPKSRRIAQNMIRSMRQIEEEVDDDPQAPHIVE